ncbi:MAG TPA: 4'-phosphopantetheinyl transferase superfamily protein [Chloroflexia bacterium]|nr:4'-phosphopantetheinyl transferase superfamily protein [Chloroflexia bacterium]
MSAHPCVWNLPPTELNLGEGEVHIWRASLDLPPDHTAMLSATLPTQEQQRAARFHFEDDRRRFVAGRGLLRAILGRYLRLTPDELEFSEGEYGKPALVADVGIRFNLAHSDGLALYAVAHAELGIDLELVRSIAESVQIAERYFSHRERAAFNYPSREEEGVAFLRQWTRKEAYLKARGSGLSLEPSEVEVLPNRDGSMRVEIAAEPGEAERWSLVDLTVSEGYVAALAIEGHNWKLRCFRWED